MYTVKRDCNFPVRFPVHVMENYIATVKLQCMQCNIPNELEIIIFPLQISTAYCKFKGLVEFYSKNA